MKFKKLTLDESLFDDDITWSTTTNIDDTSLMSGYDDDFSDPDYPTDNVEVVPEGPKAGEITGVADTLISLINDEWEAVRGYNTFIEMLRGTMQATQDANLEKMLPTIADIVNEENKHVGQLQELLKLISPNASSIQDGEREGIRQIAASGNEWVNGKLVVDVHTPISTTSEINSNDTIDTTCTLCNVDDEF